MSTCPRPLCGLTLPVFCLFLWLDSHTCPQPTSPSLSLIAFLVSHFPFQPPSPPSGSLPPSASLFLPSNHCPPPVSTPTPSGPIPISQSPSHSHSSQRPSLIHRPCLPHSHFSSHLVPFPHLHCLGPCPICIPVSAQCLPTVADLLFIAVPMPTRVPPLSLHQAPVPAQASVPVALHLWPRPHRSGSCPPHLCPHPISISGSQPDPAYFTHPGCGLPPPLSRCKASVRTSLSFPDPGLEHLSALAPGCCPLPQSES